jgi:predicted transcriptional regulator
MTKLSNNKKIRMDITIDPDLQERMIKVCQAEERSMSNLITIALKQYIAAYKKEKGA